MQPLAEFLYKAIACVGPAFGLSGRGMFSWLHQLKRAHDLWTCDSWLNLEENGGHLSSLPNVNGDPLCKIPLVVSCRDISVALLFLLCRIQALPLLSWMIQPHAGWSQMYWTVADRRSDRSMERLCSEGQAWIHWVGQNCVGLPYQAGLQWLRAAVGNCFSIHT